MKVYKILVSFAFGLALTFGLGYALGLCALPQAEWLFGLNRPVFAPTFLLHQIFGGICCVFLALLLSCTIYYKELRKALALLLPAIVLEALWAVFLFVLHVLSAAFAIALLNALLWCFLVDFYLRATKRIYWLSLSLCVYYLALALLSFSLCFLN